MKVFLGGTCNNSVWRDEIMSKLDDIKVDYFNPVVDDWNEAAYQRELMERKTCDVVIYTITPKMVGVYSIAEVVDDSNKRPKKTIFCVLEEDDDKKFSKEQMKSLKATKDLVEMNGGKVCDTLDDIVEYVDSLTQFQLFRSL